MVTKIKRYNPSEKDLVSDWHVIDAKGKVLGRLASEIATLLMGKHRPEYVPHMLSGDFVVVTNAADIVVTGNKANQIIYTRHVYQRAGHKKEVTYAKMKEKFPERVIEHAVRGMLPRNRLGERMIRMLKVYAGEEHPHAAQITGSERRPERDAAEAAKLAEAATSKKRASARADIAAEAKAKTAEVEAKAEETKAEAAVVVEEAPAEKKPAAKKPAAKKTTTAKPKTTAAKKKAETADGEKKTAAKKPAAKKPTAKKTTTTRKPSTRAKKTEE